MKSFSRSGIWALLLGGAVALPDCAGGPESSVAPAPDGPPTTEAHPVLGSFAMHVRPRARRVELRRLPKQKPGDPRLSPQNIDSLPIVSDGVTGSGPADTVELATTNITDTYGTSASGSCPAGSFCGDVQLTHFYAGLSLSAVYTQVTAITDQLGNPDTIHKVTNGISPTPFGIDVSYGAWQYTSLPGSLAAGAGSTQTWAFANPDDADFWVYLDVKASLYPMLWWDGGGLTQTAPLTAGKPTTLHYGYSRAGACRGAGWMMNGFLRGAYGANHEVSFPGVGTDTYFDVHVTTPFAASDAFWFENRDQGGCDAYDSNGGSNFSVPVSSPAGTVLHFMDPNQYGWNPTPATGTTLPAGATVVVDFEPTRVACNIDRYDRIPTGTTLQMGYHFDNDPSTDTYVDLTTLPPHVPGTINGLSGNMYAPATITLPANKQALAIWFKSTDASGCLKWDSANSANYNYAIQCTNGATQACYTGPAGTQGVGTCHAGTQTCSGGSWGACNGQVTPATESCNGADDDCNGTVDNGATCSNGLSCVNGACVYGCLSQSNDAVTGQKCPIKTPCTVYADCGSQVTGKYWYCSPTTHLCEFLPQTSGFTAASGSCTGNLLFRQDSGAPWDKKIVPPDNINFREGTTLAIEVTNTTASDLYLDQIPLTLELGGTSPSQFDVSNIKMYQVGSITDYGDGNNGTQLVCISPATPFSASTSFTLGTGATGGCGGSSFSRIPHGGTTRFIIDLAFSASETYIANRQYRLRINGTTTFKARTSTAGAANVVTECNVPTAPVIGSWLIFKTP